jgi:hypothetical protein
MEFTKGIKNLLGHSTITDIISTRSYPIQAPSGTSLPFLTYEVTNVTFEHSKDKAEYKLADVELVGYSSTYSDAVDLCEALKTRFARASYDALGIVIDNIFLEREEIEFFESPDRYACVLQVKAFLPL